MSLWPRLLPFISRALVGTCLSMIALAALSAEPRLDLRPQWKTGAQVNYVLTKTRTKQGSSRDMSATSRTDVQLRVMEATEGGFLLQAVFGETTFDDPLTQNEALARQMANLMNGLGIHMVVDRDGTVQRIRNWEEVRSGISTVTQRLAGYLKEGGAPTAIIDQLTARLTQTFSTEDNIKTVILRELNLLLLPFGRTYEAKAPITYTTELPSLVGAGTVPGKGTFELTSLDAGKGLATIRWTQTVDPQGLAKLAASTIEKLSSTPAPSGAELSPLALNDTAEFVVDVRSGWPVSIAHVRKVESGTASQTDTTSFKAR